MIVPDVNLLVYAHNEAAPSHAAARAWWESTLSRDNPVERYFRDAKVLQIIEGTNQIQRNIIGRHLIETTPVPPR